MVNSSISKILLAVVFLTSLFWRDILVSASGGVDVVPLLRWKDLSPSKESDGSQEFVVDQNGKGDYRTVQAAIDKTGLGYTRYKIIIRPGIYREQVTVPSSKELITLIGVQNGTAQTVITWNQSTTLTVEGNFFSATNITFENRGVAPIGTKSNKKVAVLNITGDFAVFYNVRILGTKNTILDERGIHYFLNSFIQGSDEFIVGNATSLYQNSTINSVAKGEGVIAVSNRNSPESPQGLAFLGSNITGTGQLLLSRASGNYSRVVFLNSDLGTAVAPQGWSDGNDSTKQKTVVFGEFNNTGKGADRSKRVPWVKPLSSSDAAPFLSRDFIDGQKWLRI